MGCDIHLFVEYKKQGDENWQGWGSEFRLDRHYGMFSALAGVRMYEDIPHIEARGMPTDIGWRVRDKYHIYIDRSDNVESGYCSAQQAEIWVARGSSKMVGKNHVTDPDAHSETWLTPLEFKKALDYADSQSWFDLIEYRVIYAALRELERLDYEARVVFWFDN